jgi:hypothetical protein
LREATLEGTPIRVWMQTDAGVKKVKKLLSGYKTRKDVEPILENTTR